MENKLQIGVRYCGGCNPRYDRVAAVRRLASLLPEADFVPVRDAEKLSAVIVVCGCTARCADTSDIPAEVRRVYIRAAEDFEPVREELEQIIAQKRGCARKQTN